MGCKLIKWEWWKHPFRFGLVFHSPPPLLSVFMSWGEAHSSPLPIFFFLFFCPTKKPCWLSASDTHVTFIYLTLPASDLNLPFKTIQTLFYVCLTWQCERRGSGSATVQQDIFPVLVVIGQKPFQQSWGWGEKLRRVRLSLHPLSFCACHLMSIETYIKLFLQSHKMLHEKPNLALVLLIHWLGCLLNHLDPGCTKASKAPSSVRSHKWPSSSTFICVSGHLSMFTGVGLIHMYFMNEDVQKSVSQLKLWPGMRNILSNVL